MRLEIVSRGVGENEPGGEGFGRSLAGARQHRLGNVEAQRFASRRDPGGEIDRRVAAAAADVDDPLAGLRVRRRNEPIGDRAQHQVLLLLAVRPSLSGGLVPIFSLGGVLDVDRRRGGHGFPSSVHAGEASGLPFSTT